MTIDLTHRNSVPAGHSRTALPQLCRQCARHRRAAEMKNPERSAAAPRTGDRFVYISLVNDIRDRGTRAPRERTGNRSERGPPGRTAVWGGRRRGLWHTHRTNRCAAGLSSDCGTRAGARRVIYAFSRQNDWGWGGALMSHAPDAGTRARAAAIRCVEDATVLSRAGGVNRGRWS